MSKESTTELFGIIKFGDKFVKAEQTDFSADPQNFQCLCVIDNNPDNYGNGSFSLQFFNGKKQDYILPNGWRIVNARGGWDWNNYRVRISLKDQFDLETEINLPYRNSGNVAMRAILEAISHIEEVARNYSSALVFELAENHPAIKDANCGMEIEQSTYNSLTHSLKSYWKIYKQFIENPVYQREMSIESRDLIAKNICQMVDIHLNAIIKD